MRVWPKPGKSILSPVGVTGFALLIPSYRLTSQTRTIGVIAGEQSLDRCLVGASKDNFGGTAAKAGAGEGGEFGFLEF